MISIPLHQSLFKAQVCLFLLNAQGIKASGKSLPTVTYIAPPLQLSFGSSLSSWNEILTKPTPALSVKTSDPSVLEAEDHPLPPASGQTLYTWDETRSRLM